MIADIVLLFVSLGIILIGASIFTNAVEWLGKTLSLSDGAVGSLLAAVGTAMPETLIPVIALLFGEGDSRQEIGIGAILGAPFMLGTLALFISGTAVLALAHRGKRSVLITARYEVIRRDLGFFLLVYSLALLAAFLPALALRWPVAISLVAFYLVYAYRTATGDDGQEGQEEHNIEACFFAPKSKEPPLPPLVAQVLVALALIILGAHSFVMALESVTVTLGLSAFILSVIIAPVATELPEKFNSIIWLSKGKDTFALGNITGAMVFQSSLIPALGMVLTPWSLGPLELITGVLTITSVATVYGIWQYKRVVTGHVLLIGGLFYVVFLALALTGVGF